MLFRSRELVKDRGVMEVHLRAASRSAKVGATEGLDVPLDFNAGGDPAANDGYEVSADGLFWERAKP